VIIRGVIGCSAEVCIAGKFGIKFSRVIVGRE